jgi:predicted dehydrogenase
MLRILAEDVVVVLNFKGVEIIEKGRKTFTDHVGDPYVAEARAFVEAVQKKDPSLVKCDYADALRTLKLTLAVQRSADTNKAVTLA